MSTVVISKLRKLAHCDFGMGFQIFEMYLILIVAQNIVMIHYTLSAFLRAFELLHFFAFGIKGKLLLKMGRS